MTNATGANTCTGNSRVVMYVVSELANTVAGYEVTYTPEGCMSFKGIQTSPTYDNVPKVAAAGEIAVIVSDSLPCISKKLTNLISSHRITSSRFQTVTTAATPLPTAPPSALQTRCLSLPSIPTAPSAAFKDLQPTAASLDSSLSTSMAT